MTNELSPAELRAARLRALEPVPLPDPIDDEDATKSVEVSASDSEATLDFESLSGLNGGQMRGEGRASRDVRGRSH